jgi:hypothetical protein
MSQTNDKQVMNDSLHSRFLQSLTQTAAKMNDLVLTENGALTHASSGSALVDFNARTTELRFAEQERTIEAAAKAYDEDALLAIKLFFQIGDIRGGKGERDVFNACMDFLAEKHLEIAVELLPLIPVYTRWDYLVRLTISDKEQVAKEATRLVTQQLLEDLNALKELQAGNKAQVSLLAKWMPSLQTKKPGDQGKVRHLLKALHMQERDYRHALSELRDHLNIVEKHMSAKDYDSIDMEKMTAKQQLRYSSFLRKVMAEKRHAYIQAVLRGEAKMNASVLNPLEIVHEYSKGNWQGSFELNEDYEALWKLLPDKTNGNGNTLVVRDGSGSMTRRVSQDSSATMLEAATALAIYCSEKLSGPFKDQFITFSARPQMVNMSGCKSLADRLTLMEKHTDCSNTDLEATFDLILDAAMIGNLKQEELPSYVLILSDMEFDAARGAGWTMDGEDPKASRQTLFERIRDKWLNPGYKLPTLVFWNLNGNRTTYPEIDSKNGVIYLSGFSTSELDLVMAGEFEKISEVITEETVIDETTGEDTTVTKTVQEKTILSPKEQLIAKLSSERYDAVEEAVRNVLKV